MTDCLPNCSALLVELFTTTGFSHSLGWLLSLSMVAGFALDNGSRELKMWTSAIVLFAIADASIRYHFFTETGGADPCTQPFMTFVLALIFIAGSALGWFLSWLARKRVHRELGLNVEEKK